MSEIHKYKTIFTLSILALIMSACGAPSQTQANISTAVAQTVQAQDSLTKIANMPTSTPMPTSVETSATADIVATSTAAPVVGAPGCTVSARLASENPPDGTLLTPGETFLKTWSLENTGTCTWDTTYKLVYRSGDLLGGLISYPLPELVAPGETKDISIYLKAPDNDGQVAGYWSLQTPWNTYFGVGPTSDPFYVQVVVSSAKKPKYEITSVTYKLTRDPESGCPTNVLYTVYATITTNGPYVFAYYWEQKDGNNTKPKTMKFDVAGSQTISREWMVGKGDSPNPRWMQIIVTAPVSKEFDRFSFPNNCP
jgi:Ig-like domain from next to BRCA1 gene